MNRQAFGAIVLVGLLAATTWAGAYVPTQYPQTTAVLQVLHADALRKEHMFLAYAARADDEGAEAMTALFAALARSQQVLADNTRQLLAKFDTEADLPTRNGINVGETRHNLEIAANIALAKIDDRYGVFLDMIRPEQNAEALAEVQAVWHVKKCQRKLVDQALGGMGFLGLGSKLPKEYAVCEVCGYIVGDDEIESRCPYCGAEGIEEAVVGSEWKVAWGLDQNTSLDEVQRAYAKRFYRLVAATQVGLVDVPAAAALAAEPYATWGLGTSGPLSDEEKAYLALVPVAAQAWQTYAAIDLGQLSDEEQQYIARMHEKYGAGPIDLTGPRQSGGFSARLSRLLDIVEALSGSALLGDKELVFLNRFELE